MVVEGLVSKKYYVRIVRGGGVNPKACMLHTWEKSVVGFCTHCTKNDVFHYTNFFSNCGQIRRKLQGLVTFPGEILNGNTKPFRCFLSIPPEIVKKL